MYMGRIVELATDRELYRNPRHPYTQALPSAVPVPAPETKKRSILREGNVPSPLDPPPGCAFHTRCLKRANVCARDIPSFRGFGGDHWVACHLT
jgi:oligopeptide/dipeptide ABC transporter ATP-binding protein